MLSTEKKIRKKYLCYPLGLLENLIMMLSQTPGHRILGSRVAVPIAGDYYAAATVQAVRNDVYGNEFVTVKFDDNNKGECRSSEIVGNGFKTIHDIKLHKHQRVFITHNRKEIMGSVEEHSDGQVRIKLMNSDECINKREEDIRLTESRYSPRIFENHDPDYRRIASINSSPSHGKKRPVTASIEVPQAGRARKWSSEPTMDELMAAMVLSNLSSSPVFHYPKSPTVRKADSPLSATSSGVGSWGQDARMSPLPGEPPAKTPSRREIISGTPERTSVIQHTHSIEHSPSSTGDHIEIDDRDSSIIIERMDDDSMEHGSPSGVIPPGHSTPAPFQTGTARMHPMQKTSSLNTPYNMKPAVKLEAVKEEPSDKEKIRPPVGSIYNMQQQILYITPSMLPAVNPEYMVHFHSMANSHALNSVPERPAAPFPHTPVLRDGRPASSTNIYAGSPPPAFYTIPLVGRQQLNSKLVFSQPRRDPSPLAARNDRPNTATPLYHIPESHPVHVPVMMKSSAQPINIPGVKAFSWHAAPQSYSSKTSVLTQRQHMHQAASPKMSFQMSPKTLPPGRKVRGDGKKCRKVYGMENRDLWCTSCRWKKACQRFPD